MPVLHVPVPYVSRVATSLQRAAGGLLQATGVEVYVQLPPLHVPDEANVNCVAESLQVVAGGVWHVMPAQGSPEHTAFEQPPAQDA